MLLAAQRLLISVLLIWPLLAYADRLAIHKAVQSCVEQKHPTQKESCIQIERDLVVLKNLRSNAHTLTIPLAPVPGVESEASNIVAGGRYLAVAWAVRGLYPPLAAQMRAGRVIGIGLNSARNRSQDQLHVHSTCVREEFVQRLRRDAKAIRKRPAWKYFIADIPSPYKKGQDGAAEMYMHRVRYIPQAYGGQNLFREIYQLARTEHSDIASHALAVIPAAPTIGAEGFLLVDIIAKRGAGGHTSVVLNDCGATEDRM